MTDAATDGLLTQVAPRLAAAADLRRRGLAAAARRVLQDVIDAFPGLSLAHQRLAELEIGERRWEPGRNAALQALGLDRAAAAAWYALGRSCRELGDAEAAISCYRRALALEPHHPAFLTSLGTALYATGQVDAALCEYRAALVAHPGHAGARQSLDALQRPATGDHRTLEQLRDEAQALHGAGRLAEALDRHRAALRLAPGSAGLWMSTGLLLNEMGAQHTALAYFEAAAHLDASLLPACEAARRICVSAGLMDKATDYSRRLEASAAGNDIRIALALTTAAIQPSADSIDTERQSLETRLDEALAAGLRATSIDAAQGLGAFFLAYHGRNDCRLQARAAALLAAAVPSLITSAAHCAAPVRREGRIRIGIVSAFLFDHSIGATTRGLVDRLSRDRFEVIVLRLPPPRHDAIAASIRAAADRTVDLDPDHSIAQGQIASLEPDILFYQDIGMDPRSYRLAFARLAPVQCVSFGHPNTTGIPTLDYFVSNSLYEPPDAQQHYTEELFLLQDLPTLAYYYRPAAPATPRERLQFGLHPEDHVYLCPQTLFKLHPDFDALLAGILRRDPAGVVVLIRGQYQEYTQQIQARFARTLADVSARVILLDRMRYERYLQLLAVADVCLDTLHFNGMNSSLEALALGTPVVTLPGAFQRGRHTQAMYRKMGMTDCIARDTADYIGIAVRLGCDRLHAGEMRARILDRVGVLFEDPRVISEFERFFLHAVRKARPHWQWPTGSTPPGAPSPPH